MACIYKRIRSPFWWVKFVDPESGLLVQESTGLRHAIPAETRQAREACRELTRREMARPDAHKRGEHWDWVRPFLNAVYGGSPLTHRLFLGMWRHFEVFFKERKIVSPRYLARDHCFEYVGWREKRGHGNSPTHRPISRNRVLKELQLMGRIMNEAVLRKLAGTNPCCRLGFKREPCKERGMITDWHEREIRAEIERLTARARNDEERSHYHALQVSFTIAMAQGCRLRETCFPLAAVDFEAGRIRLLAKGGKFYEAALNPALRPFLKKLREEGRSHTYEMPALFSLHWHRLFKTLRARHPGQFDNISFHSTRVTVISRLAQAGAPEAVVMKLVNHSSTSIHRIYRRMSKDEMTKYWGALEHQ